MTHWQNIQFQIKLCTCAGQSETFTGHKCPPHGWFSQRMAHIVSQSDVLYIVKQDSHVIFLPNYFEIRQVELEEKSCKDLSFLPLSDLMPPHCYVFQPFDLT